MGDVIDMPKSGETRRDELHKALTTLVNMAAVLLFVTAVPVNVWLWTVVL